MKNFNNEITINGVLYKYALNPISTDNNVCDLIVTPCNMPTAVYDIARITCRQNNCTNVGYYQAQINTDPVTIIQDCSLCGIVERCITDYFNQNTFCSRTNFFGF